MKLIGLDVGTRRIGVARGDTETRIAVPEGTIDVNNREFVELIRLGRVYGTTEFVVGLPRNNSGEETKQSAYVRNFAGRLMQSIPGAKVYFQDESLTSVEAEKRLKQRGKPYAKPEIDAEAAAIIMQDFLERVPAGSSSEITADLGGNSTFVSSASAPVSAAASAFTNSAPATSTTASATAPAAPVQPKEYFPPGRPPKKFVQPKIKPTEYYPPSYTAKGKKGQETPQNAGEGENGAIKPGKPPKLSQNLKNTKKEKKMEEAGKKPKKAGKIIAIILVVILVLLGGAAGVAFMWYNNSIAARVTDINCKYASSEEQIAATDSIPTVCQFKHFIVGENDTVGVIAKNLEKEDLIKSAFAFEIYARLNGASTKLQTGEYEFRQTMSVAEIVEKLITGGVVGNVFNFTILPGETITDISKKLLEQGYSATDISTALVKQYDSPILAGLYDASGNLLNSGQPREYQLEGYLYGETYQFFVDETVENIFARTLSQFNQVAIENNLEAKFEDVGLSLREGIILASIVQKEAKESDMAGVAQVFLNRLRTGMSLGSDVTATYAADITDPNRTVLTDNAAILANDSLYNTRLHAGLPPGPISQPSLSALLAVASPDTSHSHDLYFLTGDDGMMYYSDSAEGHAQNAADYCKTLCQVTL